MKTSRNDFLSGNMTVADAFMKENGEDLAIERFRQYVSQVSMLVYSIIVYRRELARHLKVKSIR